MAKILIVDDEQSICLLLKTYLTGVGHDITVLNTMYEGINELSDSVYDILVLDMNVKGINGVEMLEFIKNNRVDVKVISISGYDDLETVKLGADVFIPKPFDLVQLNKEINELLKQYNH